MTAKKTPAPLFPARVTRAPREKVVREAAPGVFVRDYERQPGGKRYRVTFEVTDEQRARKEALGYRVAWQPTLSAMFDRLLDEVEGRLGAADRQRAKLKRREEKAEAHGKTPAWKRRRARERESHQKSLAASRAKMKGTRAVVGE